MKIIKTIISVLAVAILAYTGYQYYQYTSLKNFIKHHKEAEEGFSVFTEVSSMHNSYGEVWPTNKIQLDSMLQTVKKRIGTDRLFLEKYGYNIKVDTVKVVSDTAQYEYVDYTIYSFGPDKTDNGLTALPLNQLPLTYDMSGSPLKDIGFWDYLFMDKSFDIVLVYTTSEFNCSSKKHRYTDGLKRKDKAFYMGRNMTDKSLVKGLPYKERSKKWDALDKKFNQTLQTLQQNLADQYPETPTEGLIFNYNGKRVRCICRFNVSNAPVTEIEKILTEKLKATTDYIGMTAFYMEVPVL